ncbi:MAG: deoxyguanosinetriphosphate triphosphohydrolase, partial [Gammaproteobacteria bacterium]|nr:deoxyguanosinetriphosphate triphosphohydrolase [Gammaproteobacteria bacterium]
DALNHCMREHGGFEHNLQSLRVVDELEDSYPSFKGLNLTFETREGILKHCSLANARRLGALGERFIERRQPSLEAQIANLADEIAYNNHDVDDGLRAGLITLEQLETIPFFAEQAAAARKAHPNTPDPRLTREIIRSMIGALVTDLIKTSRAEIEKAAPQTIDDVRTQPKPLIGLSERFTEIQQSLKRFLRRELYAHPHIENMTRDAHETITLLFERFSADHSLMPPEHAARADRALASQGPAGAARTIADYIAGMTDRFALEQRAKLEPREARDRALLR